MNADIEEALKLCRVFMNDKAENRNPLSPVPFYLLEQILQAMQGKKHECEHDWAWSNNGGKYYCQKCNESSYLGNHSNFQVATDSNPVKQPPKERKVSLEEIAKAIHHVKCHQLCPNERELIKRIGVSGVTYCKAQAILSLINATEERKGA